MAVVLYKNGQHQIVNEFSYLHLLDEGWSYEKEPVKEPVKEPEVKKPEVKEPEVKEPEIKVVSKVVRKVETLKTTE